MPVICAGAVVLIFFSTERVLSMELFRIMVVKLSIYKYGDVRNPREFEYIMLVFRHSLTQGNTIN